MNIEIHARSIFLQGLLVSSDTNTLPKNLSLFNDYLLNFKQKLQKENLESLEACLSFINNIPEIDKFIRTNL